MDLPRKLTGIVVVTGSQAAEWAGTLVNTNFSMRTVKKQGLQYPDVPAGSRRRPQQPRQAAIHTLQAETLQNRHLGGLLFNPGGRETKE